MKNLILGHIYFLKKDHFFYGCIAIALIMLIISIRVSSFLPIEIPVTGIDSFFNLFLGDETIIYAFMLLTVNMVSETYQSGVIKNIIGKGTGKDKYYLSIVLTISLAFLLITMISGIIAGIIASYKFGLGTIMYPSYYILAIIARILFVVASISFSLTAIIFTKNTIYGMVLALIIPNIPQIIETIFNIIKININLDLFKISNHMPTIQNASTDISPFLPCFILLVVYIALSTIIGIYLLKKQDIK